MEGVKIYAHLQNNCTNTVEGYQEDEPRAYDDASSKKFATEGNIILDDE